MYWCETRRSREVARSVVRQPRRPPVRGCLHHPGGEIGRSRIDVAEKSATRHIPPQKFRELVLQGNRCSATAAVGFGNARDPNEIQQVLAKVSSEVGPRPTGHDYSAAQRTIAALPGQQAQLRPRSAISPEMGRLRGVDRRHGAHLRGADRGRGPPDGRRPARSHPDPVQNPWAGLADRKAPSWGAPGRGVHRPGTRRPLIANFRAASPQRPPQRVIRFWPTWGR